LGIRFERLHDTGHLGYRQRGLLRQWRSFLVLLRRGLSQVRNTFSHSCDITGETSAYGAKNTEGYITLPALRASEIAPVLIRTPRQNLPGYSLRISAHPVFAGQALIVLGS
jgi:hypothetical protein